MAASTKQQIPLQLQPSRDVHLVTLKGRNFILRFYSGDRRVLLSLLVAGTLQCYGLILQYFDWTNPHELFTVVPTRRSRVFGQRSLHSFKLIRRHHQMVVTMHTHPLEYVQNRGSSTPHVLILAALVLRISLSRGW